MTSKAQVEAKADLIMDQLDDLMSMHLELCHAQNISAKVSKEQDLRLQDAYRNMMFFKNIIKHY